MLSYYCISVGIQAAQLRSDRAKALRSQGSMDRQDMFTAKHNNDHDEPETWYSESGLRQLARYLRNDHNEVSFVQI